MPAPAKLGLCVACHGQDGRGRTPETPHIGGQNLAYLRVALAAYRDGTRSHAAMNAVSGTLKVVDIDALARWYGQQQWAAPPAQQ